MDSVPAKAPDPVRTKQIGQRIMLLGLIVLMVVLPRAWDKLATQRWPSTEATIVFSDIVERTGKTHDWCVRVAYRYAIDGGRQGGVRRWGCSASRTGAEANMARMPEGQRIQVHYDPAHPERSVIDHESIGLTEAFFGALALILFAVGFDRIRHARRLAAKA